MTRRGDAQAVSSFQVLLTDQSVEIWGVEADAVYEVDKSGCLRVIVFDPLPEGTSHARTAKVYGSDDWTHVQDLRTNDR